MFIVIEGLDGTGKTTIANKLATAINAIKLSTPHHKYRDIREQLDQIYSKNTIARQLFYASTVVDVAESAKKLLATGSSVIVDRYWLSTQVYHNWMSNGKHLILPEVEEQLLVPDLTLYLELPFEERKRRLGNRLKNTKEDNLTLNKKADKTLSNLYQRYSQSPIVGCWLRIDASQDVKTIVEKVKTEILIINQM